jgi:hypothetical protein
LTILFSDRIFFNYRRWLQVVLNWQLSALINQLIVERSKQDTEQGLCPVLVSRGRKAESKRKF